MRSDEDNYPAIQLILRLTLTAFMHGEDISTLRRWVSRLSERNRVSAFRSWSGCPFQRIAPDGVGDE
jgi:hypothetical protein